MLNKDDIKGKQGTDEYWDSMTNDVLLKKLPEQYFKLKATEMMSNPVSKKTNKARSPRSVGRGMYV